MWFSIPAVIIYIITATTVAKWRFIKGASVPTLYLKLNSTKDLLTHTTPLKWARLDNLTFNFFFFWDVTILPLVSLCYITNIPLTLRLRLFNCTLEKQCIQKTNISSVYNVWTYDLQAAARKTYIQKAYKFIAIIHMMKELAQWRLKGYNMHSFTLL